MSRNFNSVLSIYEKIDKTLILYMFHRVQISKSTKYDLQNGTIIETEFLMDSEYLSGIGF